MVSNEAIDRVNRRGLAWAVQDLIMKDQCKRKSPNFKKSPIAAAMPAPSPFNARGVVANPQFDLARPSGAKDGIKITVKAHPIGTGQWIAAATWSSQCGHVPFDGSYPSKWAKVFKTRSEAVEHAIDLALRQITDQLGPLAKTPTWAKKVASAKKWAAEAIVQTRKNDETLPLHGKTVIDLCAGGLGGFGLGMSSLGAEVLLACEIDPNARSVYLQNVKPREMHADLCTLDGTKLTCDILSLGLLCQAFSPAGKRKGFKDPALAKVYQHTKRLLREITAKVVIIECARQFLTQEGGKDADDVRDLLMQSGYRVQNRILNASGFGVAQSRERSFIVGVRLDMPTDDILGYVFPTEQEPTAVVEDILEPNVPHTIADDQFVLHSELPTGRRTTIAEVGLLKSVKSQQLLDSQGYRLYSPKGLGATLTASGGGRASCTSAYLVKGHARSLTPREAARMQGMPEWAAHHPVEGHALKHAGNAVAVPVARELGRQLGAILAART
jgi:DNA (cytosine-5)-methyltransferase 1